ncbi:MAG: hypothetical protein COA79_05340 [Planctomycetota bacterium]|nr:MAG: hypothetical protein COA79_05340 [Planctomycetota bacterium]
MNQKKQKIKLNHKIEYFVFFFFAIFIRLIPRSLAYWFGRRTGSLAYIILKSRKHIALDNLRFAFPEKETSEIKLLCKECFKNLTLSMIDMFRLDLYSEKLCKEIMEIEGEEFLRKASSEKDGIIFLTAHIGFWEAGVFLFPRYGFKTNFVAKKIKNPLISEYIFEKRKMYDGDVIDKKNGLKKILKTLKNNDAIGVLLDQHAHTAESVTIDFFGRPANTSIGVIQIASKKQVPIIPVFCYRIPKNRFKVIVHKPIYLNSKVGLEKNAEEINEIIENAIKEYPSQWMWIHKRWRALN